jgi:hypothetical protein
MLPFFLYIKADFEVGRIVGVGEVPIRCQKKLFGKRISFDTLYKSKFLAN